MMVELSGGKAVEVRQLGLFEIDSVDKAIPLPYHYTVHLLGGHSEQITYPLADVDKPPQPPAIPFDECDNGSAEFYAWQEVYRYRNALEVEQSRLDAYADYCQRCAAYIRQNCIPADAHIGTPGDWDKIYHAALAPAVKMEDIQSALRVTF